MSTLPTSGRIGQHANANALWSLRPCGQAHWVIAAPSASAIERTVMNNKAAWPKVFAFLGLALIGLVFAFYATAVADGGIAAGALGHASGAVDLLSLGSAALLVGVAMFAIFGYLALKLGWSSMRERR